MIIVQALVLLAGLQLFQKASSLSDYQSRLPNGYRIPHPCFGNTVWKGVGHQNHGGGGLLNPFGEDFRRNGFKWDRCLCEADSDGDGLSNGVELGDPDCEWSEGQVAKVLEGISHPGVCEPISSPECTNKNNWDICKAIEFDCPATEWNDTEEILFRFKELEIPSNETSYYCMAVDFNETLDMHAFAMKAFVDNEALVHHIDMNACENEDAINDAKLHYSTPQPCGFMKVKCNSLFAAWSLGVNGICVPDNVGVRVGKYGVRTSILRIHYHNPLHKQGEKDTSGLSIFVTQKLRQYHAGVVNFGQSYLEIPPGQVQHDEQLECVPACTNMFPNDIYLVFGTMHMHYLGTGGFAELWRDGKKIQDIMRQDFYDYNSPHIEYFDPPIHVKPGDTIRHTCRYQSMDRNDVTWRGQSASDEMCHIYFVYYPDIGLASCGWDGKTGNCRFANGNSIRDYASQNCDNDDFAAAYSNYIREELAEVCDITGQKCNDGCQEKLDWAMTNHSCLSGDARDSMFRRNDDLNMMQSSCKSYPPLQESVPQTTITYPEGACPFGINRGISGYSVNWVLYILPLCLLMLE